MLACTFAGHREVFSSKVDAQITKSLSELLRTDTEFIFYTGGMGDFDKKCESAVRLMKKDNPKLSIRLILVLPYMTNRLNTEKEYFETYFDDVIIPTELCDVHYKAAIKMRNRWMVEHSDRVLAYIRRNYGGAFETIKYAHQQGRLVLNLAEKE